MDERDDPNDQDRNDWIEERDVDLLNEPDIPSKFRSPGATNSEASRDSGLMGSPGAIELYQSVSFRINLCRIPRVFERFDVTKPRQIRGRIHGPSGDLGPHKGKPTRKGKRVPSDEGKGPRYA
jgi:hypothetical protein